jgi:hypothetical protein
LRADFPLNLPHINPHREGELVSPCLFEGSLDELLHRFGLDAIVDQLIDWLHKAAAGTLLDLGTGVGADAPRQLSFDRCIQCREGRGRRSR